MKKFFKSLFSATFTRDGEPFLPYIYTFIFLILIMIMYIMKLCGSEYLSDEFVNNCLKYVVVWMGVITGGRIVENFIER
ncbi:MAG: hypothetical protein LBI03_01155 [Clostridiales bacterium]|nr:hypothetical protein [Clostridiales bacterium]